MSASYSSYVNDTIKAISAMTDSEFVRHMAGKIREGTYGEDYLDEEADRLDEIATRLLT